MDMQLHWLQCREAQKQLHIYWAPGQSNLGDYPSKYHLPQHHEAQWPLRASLPDTFQQHAQARVCRS